MQPREVPNHPPPAPKIGKQIYSCRATQACVKVCVRELAKRDPSFADSLKKKTYAKLGREHPDLRAVRPCPVPLVIVGNKYDIFKVRIEEDVSYLCT